MNYKFVEPIKTKPHTGGYLVIESDDGRLSDLEHWTPMMYRIAKRYDKFYPQSLVFGCSNVNTGFLNEGFRPTNEQLKRLHSVGWEVIAHGRYHAGMGLYPVRESVNAGERLIKVMASERINPFSPSGYEYIISEGGNNEIIRIDSQTGDSHGAGTITTVNPLLNSYTTNAKIQLTDASRVQELQGCIDDLRELGINTRHYVYPYHSGAQSHPNPHAVSEVGKIFASARGRQGHSGLNNVDQSDFEMNRLNAILLNDALTKDIVNDSLVSAKESDSVFILYGHGESPGLKRFEVLEYTIERALELGIKIISREEAYIILSQR